MLAYAKHICYMVLKLLTASPVILFQMWMFIDVMFGFRPIMRDGLNIMQFTSIENYTTRNKYQYILSEYSIKYLLLKYEMTSLPVF